MAEAQRDEAAVSFVASASTEALDRAAGGVTSYREAAPTREKLWQVLESPAVDAAGATVHQQITKIYFPQKTKQTQFLGDGDAKAGAAQLAEKLRTEARIF